MWIIILFWVFSFLVFYTYLGYGILIWAINRITHIFKSPPITDNNLGFSPEVALVITAYNEQDCIEQKIQNTHLLDYPSNKLHVYFITDGSSDLTYEIINKHPEFTLLHQPNRQGKAAAMNRAIQFVREPYVIFCDANSMLNPECIIEIVQPYRNSRVGAVAGEKKIYQAPGSTVVSKAEGLYWRYESFLKEQDSILYCVVGVAGELFSLKRELYQPLEEDIIIEDFVLSLRITTKGFLVKYVPTAYAIETATVSIKEERKRKVRICAGGFQAMYRLLELLNIFRFGVLSFQYISHRVLRWSLAPLCLFLLFPLNLILVASRQGVIYDVLLVIQLIFYILAIAGGLLANRNARTGWLYIPYYFLFMNMAVFLGLRRFLRGQQSVLWEKVERGKVA